MSVGFRTSTWMYAGIVFSAFGLLLIFASYRSTSPYVGAAFNIGIIAGAVGVYLLFAYFFSYEILSGFAFVHRDGKVETEGWHYGLYPNSAMVVPTKRIFMEIPGNGLVINLDTPDGGILGAAVRVSYSPDLRQKARTYLENRDNIGATFDTRIRAGLTRWIRQKPLPGNLKKALSMQAEAETYLRSQLATGGTDEFLFQDDDVEYGLYTDGSYPIADLGLRLHEVHILAWMNQRAGTDKPDWGDGDHVGFDAQAIFKQFSAHTDNLSSLRRLKEALIEKYKDEESDIEDIYDQVRISMKENRER